MTIRRVAFAVVLVILAALAITRIPTLKARLKINKASYLMNQQRWADALQILERLPRRSGNLEATRMMAVAQINLREFEGALKNLGLLPQSGDNLIARGVSEYELGQEARALDSFRKSLKMPLANANKLMATTAVNALSESTTAAATHGYATWDVPVYEIVFTSLRGRQLFWSGNYRQSVRDLELVIAAGDRNPSIREYAATALACLGHFNRALLHLDYSTRSDSAEGIQRILNRMTAHSPPVPVTGYMADQIIQQRFQIARSGIWAELGPPENVHTSSSLQGLIKRASDLAKHAPSDASLQMLSADLLERTGNGHAAYTVYDSILAKQFSLSAYLRQQALLGPSRDAPDIPAHVRANVAAYLTPDEMTATRAVRRRNYLAMFQQSSVSMSVEITQPGELLVNVVGRSDRAFGKSALVAVRVDGRYEGTLYLARESWDCYSLPVTFDAGNHLLEIEYINNSDGLISNEQDRNMYIEAVILSAPGAFFE